MAHVASYYGLSPLSSVPAKGTLTDGVKETEPVETVRKSLAESCMESIKRVTAP